MLNTKKLIVALDLHTSEMAMDLVYKLEGHANFFKIGLGLIAKGGLDLAMDLKRKGKSVFLDLKLFDIESTIERAVSEITNTGVDFITVHGDPQVIKAAVSGRENKKTKILAVTFLTSLNRRDLDQSLIKAGELSNLVLERAEIAITAGADGVIASPQEISLLRQSKICSKHLIITPGIRPKDTNTFDQKRASTPSKAISAGADYLVIGRPIYQSTNPLGSFISIANEVNKVEATL
jgi:orotidine-5'-phosphate decarboxylase